MVRLSYEITVFEEESPVETFIANSTKEAYQHLKEKYPDKLKISYRRFQIIMIGRKGSFFTVNELPYTPKTKTQINREVRARKRQQFIDQKKKIEELEKLVQLSNN